MQQYTILIILAATALFLAFATPTIAQTKKQVRKAFTADKPPVEVEFYCRSRKIYKRKLKRFLRRLDSLNIEYKIKITYIESRFNFFYFKYVSEVKQDASSYY